MQTFEFNWQHVIDHQGIALSVTGMIIVFTALLLISSAIALLPHVLDLLANIIPEQNYPHTQKTDASDSLPEHKQLDTNDQLAVVAAIGFVMHYRSRT